MYNRRNVRRRSMRDFEYQQRETYRVVNSATGAWASPVEQSSIDASIALFNSIYAKTPTRALNAQIEDVYNNLKSKYWNLLTAAQQKGLTEKLWAFQERLRAIEAGKPITTPAAVDVTHISIPTTAVPAEETYSVFGWEIPKHYVWYAGAGLAAIVLLDQMGE